MTTKAPEPSPESRPTSAAASTTSPDPAQAASGSASPATSGGASPAASGGESPVASTPESPPAADQPPPPPPAQTAKPPATKAAPAKPAPPPRSAPPPPARPKRPNSSGGGGAAMVVAVCSLLVAIGASAVAVYALDVAREAKSQAAIAMSSDDRVARGTPSPGATGAPVAASPSPTATPGPVYVAELLQSELRIPPAQGCASVFVDVDNLRVGVDAGHEFYLSTCVGSQTLRIDRTEGAVAVPSGTPTPQECADLLARNSFTAELSLQPRAGLVFCLMTAKAEADRQGIPQRIGIVEVRSVATDLSVTVAVSTYRVPA